MNMEKDILLYPLKAIIENWQSPQRLLNVKNNFQQEKSVDCYQSDQINCQGLLINENSGYA